MADKRLTAVEAAPRPALRRGRHHPGTSLRSRRLAGGAAIVLALQLPACGRAGATAALSTVRDSAGITLVENAAPDDSSATPWWTVGAPTLDIGGADAEGESALFRVTSALQLKDGSIVVANGGSTNLRVFTGEGAPLRTIGRQGGGPGEFQSVSSIARWAGDSLLVADGLARRVTVFSADGVYGRDLTLAGTPSPAAFTGALTNGSIMGSASLFGAGPPPPMAATAGMDGPQRADVVVLRFSGTGASLDTIGRFAGTERFIRTQSSGGQLISFNVIGMAFGRTTTFLTSGDELWATTRDQPEVRVFGPAGELRRIVRTGQAPQPVTPELKTAWIERQVARVPEADRARVRQGYEAVPAAEFVPPFGAVLADDTGRMWVADVERPDRISGRWTVYGPDGRLQARIVLPERFRPMDIVGDDIVGIWTDDDDVEHLRRFRIQR